MSAADERDPHEQWPDLVWRWRRFDDLSPRELQNIYSARQRVFALEQQCLFIDADGHDEAAFHLAAWTASQREPLAYARVLDPGVKYMADCSIGRVVTTPAARGHGLGRAVVRRAIRLARATWPDVGIRISAQTRLEDFYRSLGFDAVGVPYVEDGIDHTEMHLHAPGANPP